MKIKEQPENRFYVYAYLDPRKPGIYTYGEYTFDYEPFYIGKGTGSRLYRHLWESENNTTNNYKFRLIKKIIEETNNKPIIIKLKSNLTNSESIKLEMNIIKKIGKKSNGGILTNVLNGGEIIVNNLDKQKTNSIIRLQYDLENNFIKEWESAMAVQKELGINNSLISSVCLGKIKTAGGFIWKNKIETKFVKNIRKICKQDIKKKFSKKISQYDLNNVFVKNWNSISSAQKQTGIKNISYCINGKRKTAGGFIWKYRV